LIGSKKAFGASSGRNEGAWRKLRKQAGLMRLNLDRRKFLEISGEAGLALAGGLLAPGSLGTDGAAGAEQPASPAAADYTIRIAPISHEIAPGKIINTTAYNGSAPGPVLRSGLITYS
jgi:hypothetical protein